MQHLLQRTPTNQTQPKHKHFRVLSQNVQRIISHSNSDGDIIETERKIDQETSTQIINSTKYFKRIGSVKNKHTNIPLSKNTCKLTQAGNELVDTLDAKIFSSNESLDGIVENKRLSNAIGSIQELRSVVPQKLAKSNNIQKIIRRLQSIDNNPTDDESEESNKMSSKNNHSHDDHKSFAEAVNYCVKVPDLEIDEDEKFKNLEISDVKNNEIETEETVPMQATIDSILESNSINHLDEIEQEVVSTERISLPRAVTESPFTNKTSITIPDIARLKHRPLSASSICSTSSSSSSGSENLPSKLGVSYLASVESLADQSENEFVSGNLTLCERACREIIDSEKIYVDDLGQVITGYLHDWKERACLPLDWLKTLFSNIEDVYEFNSILLKQLLNSGADPVNIAKCFLSMKDRFDAYTVYCTRYPEAISLLTSLLQASDTNALLTLTQKMLQHTLPLGSYLLKPVKRILRYHLLLDNLRKHCDVNEVTEAHLLMKDVAKNIDQVKKNLEQQSRVKELSGILDGWLGPELTVLGDLKLEGPLMENSKPRIVLLFQTMLIITKKKEDNRLQYKNFIHCKHLMLIEHLRGEPTSFNVIPYNDPHPSQIKLTARNREQKRQWAHHIKQVMLAHFDIPSRAVELVFKLGDDEEEPAADKNTWKWGTNSSTATPEYLERRNQYRRSEMRYRSSKKQRKIMATSISMEGFDNKSQEKYSNRSIDDSASLSSKGNNYKIKTNCDHRDDDCNCSIVKSELTSTLSRKNGIKNKDARGRSKSEPRISDIFVNKHSHLREQSSAKLSTESLFPKSSTMNRGGKIRTEVKMYNTKTLPKRIANLKKQRAKSMKETSKFYMDLPVDDTVLRITESTENIDKIDSTNSTEETKTCEVDKSTAKSDHRLSAKKDIEIICDLLKDKQKEFDRILNKPPKKKSFDNGKYGGNQDIPAIPPPDDEESTEQHPNEITCSPERISRLNSCPSELNNPEPIYESLLRNVHVPYKYSPVLSRSISQPQKKSSRVTKRDVKRPESDYVTLVYSKSGQLKSVDGHLIVASLKDDPLTMRSSDSNINYNKVNASLGRDDEGISSSSSGNLDSQNSLINETGRADNNSNNECGIKGSCSTISNKSIDNISTKTSRSQRRVSELSSEMIHQDIIHKQGGETLGSRIAHLDYADPKTLFSSQSNNNILINKHFLKTQSDSVFSLTSSNDSVNDTKNHIMEAMCNDSYYEKSVEDSLEKEDVFRDSAIYSDDCNERKPENLYEVPNCSPPPLPRKSPPRIPKKPVRNPPPLPPKPNLTMLKIEKNENSELEYEQLFTPDSDMLSPSDSGCSRSSWVSQQIKHFEK